MFSVFFEEGSVATVSTLSFAAPAFCACATRPAEKRYRQAAAAIAARMMFAILHLVIGTEENRAGRTFIDASPYRARASRHPVCAFAALGAAPPPLRGG